VTYDLEEKYKFVIVIFVMLNLQFDSRWLCETYPPSGILSPQLAGSS
jgi:hypothetical protein